MAVLLGRIRWQFIQLRLPLSTDVPFSLSLKVVNTTELDETLQHLPLRLSQRHSFQYLAASVADFLNLYLHLLSISIVWDLWHFEEETRYMPSTQIPRHQLFDTVNDLLTWEDCA